MPPLPPRIHRKLVVHLHPDGLLIVPLTDIQDGQEPEESEVEGFKIGWGVKGRIEGWQGRIETDEDAVELGGILGLVRLWDGESQKLVHLVTSLRLIRHYQPRMPSSSCHLPNLPFLCSGIMSTVKLRQIRTNGDEKPVLALTRSITSGMCIPYHLLGSWQRMRSRDYARFR